MKSLVASPKGRVRETKKDIQEEIRKFIVTTLKHGLKRLMEDIRVPPVRRAWGFQHFSKYERRRSHVDAAIGRLFFQGVSTCGLSGTPGSSSAGR